MKHDLDEVKAATERIIAENPHTRNPMTASGTCLYNGPDGTGCVAQTVLRSFGYNIPETHERLVVKQLAGLEQIYDSGKAPLDDLPLTDQAARYLNYVQSQADDVDTQAPLSNGAYVAVEWQTIDLDWNGEERH